MSGNQVSALDFNIFDVLVNLIPGLLTTLILLYVLDLGISAEMINSLTFFFILVVASYVFGHFIQYLSSFFYVWIFGHPTELEKNLQKKGVTELHKEYLQAEVGSKHEAIEYDDTDIDSWIVSLTQDPGFQSLEAKLIYLLETKFRMQQTVSSVNDHQAEEVFQIIFAHVVNRGVTKRVERFFAIANLFRSLAFLFVGFGILAVPLVVINGREFSVFSWSGVLLNLETVPIQFWDNALFIVGIAAIGFVAHCIYRNYRKYLIRALVADFVSDYYPQEASK